MPLTTLPRLAALLTACALSLPAPALATQEYILPTLFDVTGVAADDVLNIRQTPSARAAIIGSFAANATKIEVVAHSPDGKWAQVNTPDGMSGWVALRFLNYRTDVWQGGALPDGLICSGTEPFWSIEPRGAGLVWSTPDGEQIYPQLSVLDRGYFRDPTRALVAEGPMGQITASLTPAACSDGMSERAYGLRAELVLRAKGQAPVLVSGCCRIAAP